jgi:hypothetical protein
MYSAKDADKEGCGKENHFHFKGFKDNPYAQIVMIN